MSLNSKCSVILLLLCVCVCYRKKDDSLNHVSASVLPSSPLFTCMYVCVCVCVYIPWCVCLLVMQVDEKRLVGGEKRREVRGVPLCECVCVCVRVKGWM
jgi:hypothetical protein